MVVVGISSLLCATTLRATSPQLTSVLPTGGRRGTELEVTFSGDRLQDTEEILSYEPGIQVLKPEFASNKVVTAQMKIAPDSALGEHHFRLRTATGLSDLRTFMVGPSGADKAPNNEPAKAQKIALNSTVTEINTSEDVDCFAVELKKGQRFSVEVEGMRLGRTLFDPWLAVLDPEGSVLASADDTWLGIQDPFLSLIAPRDGSYTVQLREATYGGSDKCHYRLHVGTFPRPAAVFPQGGGTGEKLTSTYSSQVSAE